MWIEILIAAALAVWAIFAVRAIVRRRRKGGCSGDCAGCPHGCKREK